MTSLARDILDDIHKDRAKLYLLPIEMRAKSLQLPFNLYFNVHVLCDLSSILIPSAASVLNLSVNLFCPVDPALVLIPGNFHSFLPPSCSFPGGPHLNLSRDAIFTVYSNIFLFWLKKTSVNFETRQLGFRVFICAFHSDISPFFRR